MMCYERALRVLCEIEYPRPNVLPPKLYDQHIKRIAHTKYTYLVAAQVRSGLVEGVHILNVSASPSRRSCVV